MQEKNSVAGFLELLNWQLGKPYDATVLAEFLTRRLLERVDYE